MGSKKKKLPPVRYYVQPVEEDEQSHKKEVKAMFDKWYRDYIKSKTKPAKKQKKAAFKCPICGCKEYKEHRSLIRPMRYGGENPTKLDCYSCAGCSVHFYSPTQFTNAGKKKRAAGKKKGRQDKDSLEEFDEFIESVLDNELRSLAEDPPKNWDTNIEKIRKTIEEAIEMAQKSRQHETPSIKPTGIFYK